MVAEAWIVRMGSQVSSNLKHALLLEPWNSNNKKNLKREGAPKQTLGILSFEVANVMSKTIHLHKSLIDAEISKLKSEILRSEGIKTLVSSDENFILDRAMAEKLDDLNHVASVVSRLGKKCSEPALQGFEHVFGDIVNGVIDVRKLSFLVKDMDGMVRKMERYVSATSNLYCEMEVLNELEQASKKFQLTHHEESRKAFEQKLIWQRHDVRHLRETSLWNQTYDKVVEMLARSVCTIFARICVVFGNSASDKCDNVSIRGSFSPFSKDENRLASGQVDAASGILNGVHRKSGNRTHSGALVERRAASSNKQPIDSRRGEAEFLRAGDFNFPCGTNPGRLFMECLSLSSSVSRLDDDDDDADDSSSIDHSEQSSQMSGYSSVANGRLIRDRLEQCCLSYSPISSPFSGDQRSQFGPRNRLTSCASPSTVGGSGLALHYANIIIVVEKLLRYPHLVGEEARDDLYHMLPTSLKRCLKANLRSYFKHVAIYDAPLAHSWKETLDGVLGWLAPLAHNMIRWQSERNFEQQQIVKRTNVLLIQTLYFADRGKTEAALCKLLVGLNYICHYEHQQNALLDCTSSFDYEDYMEWQRQLRPSYID